LKLPDPPPFWASVEIVSKLYFESITNSLIIAALIVAEHKFSLHGLRIIIFIGFILMAPPIYIRSWQLSEAFRAGKPDRNNFLVSIMFSALSSILTVATLAALVSAAQEIIKRH
jgi:small-conductance mechanosensitive channel